MRWSPSPPCLTDAPLPRVLVVPDSTECADEVLIEEAIAVVGKSTASTFYSKNSATGACEQAAALPATAVPLLLGEESSTELPEVERTIRR